MCPGGPATPPSPPRARQQGDNANRTAAHTRTRAHGGHAGGRAPTRARIGPRTKSCTMPHLVGGEVDEHGPQGLRHALVNLGHADLGGAVVVGGLVPDAPSKVHRVEAHPVGAAQVDQRGVHAVDQEVPLSARVRERAGGEHSDGVVEVGEGMGEAGQEGMMAVWRGRGGGPGLPTPLRRCHSLRVTGARVHKGLLPHGVPNDAFEALHAAVWKNRDGPSSPKTREPRDRIRADGGVTRETPPPHCSHTRP